MKLRNCCRKAVCEVPYAKLLHIWHITGLSFSFSFKILCKYNLKFLDYLKYKIIISELINPVGVLHFSSKPDRHSRLNMCKNFKYDSGMAETLNSLAGQVVPSESSLKKKNYHTFSMKRRFYQGHNLIYCTLISINQQKVVSKISAFGIFLTSQTFSFNTVL